MQGVLNKHEKHGTSVEYRTGRALLLRRVYPEQPGLNPLPKLALRRANPLAVSTGALVRARRPNLREARAPRQVFPQRGIHYPQSACYEGIPAPRTHRVRTT